jgi:hypothetical protein
MSEVTMTPEQEAAIENLLIDEAVEVRDYLDLLEKVQDYVIETSVDSGRDPLEAINMLSDLVGMKNNLKKLVA